MNTTKETTREPPEEGQVWLHYKGGKYRIIALATETDSGLPYVCYRSLLDGKIWTRMLHRFMSRVQNCEHVDGIDRYTLSEE